MSHICQAAGERSAWEIPRLRGMRQSNSTITPSAEQVDFSPAFIHRGKCSIATSTGGRIEKIYPIKVKMKALWCLTCHLLPQLFFEGGVGLSQYVFLILRQVDSHKELVKQIHLGCEHSLGVRHGLLLF